MAWLDLSAGPVVLETPDTQGRYYLMPLVDAWGNVYASIGKRTTGTFPNRYLIVGPHWNGTLPSGTQAIRSPTEISWVVGRLLPDKKNEKALTSKIQQGNKLIYIKANQTCWPNRRLFLGLIIAYYKTQSTEQNCCGSPS